MFATHINTSNQTASAALLVTRVAVSMMMLTHGLPKLDLLLAGSGDLKFPSVLGLSPLASLGLAVFSEVGGSILLIAGIFTRFAAAALAVTMLVAATVMHANDPFGVKELSLLYLVAYVLILLLGPGKFSLDHLLFSKKGSGPTVRN